jgi:alanine racemase
MNRLGFAAEDLPEVKNILNKDTAVRIQSVFSHLASSENPKDDDFSRHQIARFEEMSHFLSKDLGYTPMRHILNSAGIARFPEAQFDMVRLGLGLYGIDSAHFPQLHLQQVGTLKATISQIKSLRKGDTVGYNRSYKAKKNMRIATVGIGYADGIDRRLSNGVGGMLVGGKWAPIVGKVCMDMTMIDITHIEHVREGDTVIVFGEQLPITRMAQLAGTIPYEILTGISARVQKIFYQE